MGPGEPRGTPKLRQQGMSDPPFEPQPLHLKKKRRRIYVTVGNNVLHSPSCTPGPAATASSPHLEASDIFGSERVKGKSRGIPFGSPVMEKRIQAR